MLKLTVGGEEFYDEVNEEFIVKDSFTLKLEHSLLAIAKWEQQFQKPFLGSDKKTKEETLAYIEAMIIDDDYPEDILEHLSLENLSKVSEYVDSPATATTFSDFSNKKPKGPRQVITSELIYYWMVAATIPLECERWNLNRLFALLRICEIKSSKPKKMPKNEIAARNRALNEQRKAQLNTSG